MDIATRAATPADYPAFVRLAACRAHARPEIDFLRLAIEGDRALAELLLAAGAELAFEILRLGAPLGGR